MIDPLLKELLQAYGWDAGLDWKVLDDLGLRLTISMRRRGGFDAGDFVGQVKVIAKTPRGCIKAALKKFDDEPWIKSAIYGPRF